MAPLVDHSAAGRLSLVGHAGEIALLPLRFLLRLPVLSVQVLQFCLKEVIVRPTVLAAILLHGGLLVLPVLDLAKPESEEVNASPEAEEPIEVQSLGDLIAASPEAQAPPPEQPAPPPNTPPAQQQVITEVPTDLPQEELPPIPDTPQPAPVNEPEPEPLTPSFNAEESQSSFLAFAGSGGYQDSALPSSFKSEHREFFYTADDVTRSGRPKFTAQAPRFPPIMTIFSQEFTDVAGSFGIADQLVQASGMSLFDAGTYGPFPLYGAQDANGNVPLYITIVEGQITANSLIVFWSSDPNG